MQKSLLFKTLLVVGLTVLLGVPLSLIQSVISERMQFHEEAVRSIASDSVREQSVIGPVLVVPYTDEYEEEQTVSDDKGQKTKLVKRVDNKRLLVFPNDLQIKGTIDTDRRYRGIHKVLVYSGQHAISGDFVLPAAGAFQLEKPNSILRLGQPFVAMAIDDVRGIRNIPTMTWGERQIEFRQGAELHAFQSGLHAPVEPFDPKHPATVKFSFDLGLDGIQRLQFAPVGKNNQVTLSSRWPHPQFGGRFLPSPKTRTVTADGFSATWNISALATAAQQQLRQIEQPGKPVHSPAGPAAAQPAPALDHFSVAFIEPINVYSQADRAIKYGLLFVALTFAAFFLFEMLKQLPIHPVQYSLVGLALALFFLLLISLSEHIRFEYAYLIASSACIVLIGFYLNHVLRNWKRGFGFASILTLLYGVLYGLLRSENNALVMGSILLFGVLTAIMIATRKVDWYRIGKPEAVKA